jgi:predicted transcriptional regulator
MAEVTLDHPVPVAEEEEEATLAAIDRGLEAADRGHVVPFEEVRERMKQWLSKSCSPKSR